MVTGINYSTVTRWVKRINDGQEEHAESDLSDRPRSGRPSSAHSSANTDQADALCSVPKNFPNYVDSQSHKKSL